MSIGTSPGYLVRRVQDAPTVPCPCGSATRVLGARDGAPCSFHITEIRDSVRHYHRETTEVYSILEGSGKMELNGEWVDVEPGVVVWIEPETRHRLVSEAGIRTVIVGVPAFNPHDEWFDSSPNTENRQRELPDYRACNLPRRDPATDVAGSPALTDTLSDPRSDKAAIAGGSYI